MAKKSEFRFESILQIRKAREDERKRTVAVRLRVINELQVRCEALQFQVREQTAELRSRLSSGLPTVDDLRWGRGWIGRLRQEIIATEAKIAGQAALLAQDRSLLTAARKETRVMERLKERQRDARAVEAARREQTETDEMNVARYARFAMAPDGVRW